VLPLFRVHNTMKTRTLEELARLLGAELDGDAALVVEGPASLSEAGPRQISFLANPRYRAQLLTTRAGAVVVGPDETKPRPDLSFLRCADPSRAFTSVVTAFVDDAPRLPPGIHPSAVVEPGAEIDASASVGAQCVVESGARIGARAQLRAGVCVGRDAQVGADSVLHPRVVLYAGVSIGARCVLHAGCVIGADGFGFEPTKDGWVKIPQCGTVVVEDDVEIGANTTIDRARFGATRIGRGVKLDNLVHLAHNVEVGELALVIAQTGVAGSARIGKRAIVAGQVGVAGHVHIGDGARVAAQSGVFGDVPAGADYMGHPARPRVRSLRVLALVQRLPEFEQRLRELERAREPAGSDTLSSKENT
jgi:UDP-3-O-[3-hydroxymyristoyl] glucosamine N-acyltransferase